MIPLALACAAILGAYAGHAIGKASADVDQHLRDELIAIEIERGEIR
jgi:hypothetical protein